MLGTLRFILAWFVMLSHLPFSPFPIGFNPGVSSVILFYFISGYLMFFSFAKIPLKKFKQKMIFFYLKRIFRLFPLYLIILFFTIFLIHHYQHSNLIPLLNQNLSISKIFINMLLIFNNYVFPPFQIKALLPHPLIPTTWSLSSEWHYYLLVPFLFYLLIKKKKIFIYVILLFSLAFELYAFSHNSPLFNADNFGYRYIFGVLWIFLVGFLFAQEGYSKFLKVIYFSLLVYFLLWGFYYSNHPYSREILFAVFFAPVLPVIKNLEFKYDYYLGQLSYPIFISQFSIFYLVEHLIGYDNKVKFFMSVFGLVLIISIILAFIHIILYPFLTNKFSRIVEKKL